MTNYKERNSSYRDPVYALKDPIQASLYPDTDLPVASNPDPPADQRVYQA